MQQISKIRIDQLLVNKKIVDSRNKAKALVEKGHVYIDEKKIDKASREVNINSEIKIEGIETMWVARSYIKLLHAIKHWQISVENFVCLDIGASTGGFCQVLLENGAKKIYALDVGHNQLHESINNDERVINIEGFNAREIDETTIPEKLDFICMDVSFISIQHVIPKLKMLLKENRKIITLFKPQFEVGKKYVDKNGVVKNKIATKIALEEVYECIKESGLKLMDTCKSPIKGSQGNEEYLILIQN